MTGGGIYGHIDVRVTRESPDHVIVNVIRICYVAIQIDTIMRCVLVELHIKDAIHYWWQIYRSSCRILVRPARIPAAIVGADTISIGSAPR